ncbi:MAG TPA: asparagine synthase-related protein, partial [Candidatus Acidoferrales bacterium]|nr:asparagine synthase-related protein [Candidatus Acidoferrales bacterium]
MLTEETRATTPLVTNEIPSELYEKKSRVLNQLKAYGRALVAFSGGIDSTLLAALAKEALGKNALAVTADSPSIPAAELIDTKHLAQEIGIKHLIIRTDELDDPNYVANPANRCYFCKKELAAKLT